MTRAPVRCKVHRVLCDAMRSLLLSEEPIAIRLGAEISCIAVVAGFGRLLAQARP
jgi:hypothetical protein